MTVVFQHRQGCSLRHYQAKRESGHVAATMATDCDSVSTLPAWRASPVCSDEKSNISWMFCRLSRLRFMSYLPLLSFGSSITVPGSAYLLAPPFGIGVPSFADDVIYYTLC